MRQPRHPKRDVTLVEENLDFSVRKITRSCAKRIGMKPTSAIPIKPIPLCCPKAKKLKLDPATSQELPLPPPTLIATMQAIGSSLGIASEELSVDKLMAPPQSASRDDVSHDE